ncbi:MAG: hypothetical protein JWO43_556 [Candidatus Adlerbacteria bacterium]|nr:hypothetical protein [Candidatus Adlerbacteria bacterium]
MFTDGFAIDLERIGGLVLALLVIVWVVKLVFSSSEPDQIDAQEAERVNQGLEPAATTEPAQRLRGQTPGELADQYYDA